MRATSDPCIPGHCTGERGTAAQKRVSTSIHRIQAKDRVLVEWFVFLLKSESSGNEYGSDEYDPGCASNENALFMTTLNQLGSKWGPSGK